MGANESSRDFTLLSCSVRSSPLCFDLHLPALLIATDNTRVHPQKWTENIAGHSLTLYTIPKRGDRYPGCTNAG